MPKLKVCELFAGVGGFRLGLEKTDKFEVIWSNQWEPSTKAQHASWVYEARFGSKNHSNKNIEEVPTSQIPDHDVLVGGFPCQDYSVATSLKNSKGLLGKKGVLWWSIHRILSEKENKPKYLILENVDRLLKSPSSQRGRDFAIMLKSLSELGYCVEWRVVEGGLSPFQTTGFCFNQQVTTIKALPEYKGKTITIADILLDTPVDSDFFIPEKDLPKWEYLKGAKKEVRKTKTGFKYNYSEGSMIFPDPLNKPSRTIITGEGGKSPSRFKHVVQTKFGLRRLTPIELERLNMFPDNHTLLDRVSDTKRAFFMGNALIVGIVERLGEALFDKIKESTQWS